MTNDALNLGLLPVDETGAYNLPVVGTDAVPTADSLIPFNRAKTCLRRDVGVHFFIDDYQFERVWKSPQLYVEMLKRYRFVCAPDFSLYLDMPMAAKIWNVYRSRLITAYWQKQGVKVVPVLQWADPATWEFCFKGVTPGGTVAVSTLGAARNKLTKQIWKSGMSEAIQKLRPAAILLYGRPINFNFGNIHVVCYTNEVLERRSGHGR
ncbi:MAG: DUF4417 domain-containing protein [Bacteroidales bacterium]|nr:DUF4417 domain-containing protein [Bacteroidales bacterium]